MDTTFRGTPIDVSCPRGAAAPLSGFDIMRKTTHARAASLLAGTAEVPNIGRDAGIVRAPGEVSAAPGKQRFRRAPFYLKIEGLTGPRPKYDESGRIVPDES